MNMQVLFAFDWSTTSLIYVGPHGLPVAIHANMLVGLGWKFDEAEARKTLPRFDRSQIAGVPVVSPEEQAQIRRVLAGGEAPPHANGGKRGRRG